MAAISSIGNDSLGSLSEAGDSGSNDVLSVNSGRPEPKIDGKVEGTDVHRAFNAPFGGIANSIV